MDERYILVGEKLPSTIWGKSCWDGAIISQNEHGKYYWISIGIFGLNKQYSGNSKSVIVLPGTPEHEKLTELIKTKDNSVIDRYAQILAIKYLPPEDVYSIIEEVKETKYQQGRYDAQSEMRNALGIVKSNYSPYFLPSYQVTAQFAEL